MWARCRLLNTFEHIVIVSPLPPPPLLGICFVFCRSLWSAGTFLTMLMFLNSDPCMISVGIFLSWLLEQLFYSSSGYRPPWTMTSSFAAQRVCTSRGCVPRTRSISRNCKISNHSRRYGRPRESQSLSCARSLPLSPLGASLSSFCHQACCWYSFFTGSRIGTPCVLLRIQ